ncbi:MAG: hypothetical protein AAGB18_06905 [Pseudomonadota bacterium]
MAQGLDITFQTNDRPVPALGDVSLMVNQGEVVCFNDASGFGKTTFQRANAARDTPTGGAVSVVSLDAARCARAFGYVLPAAGRYPTCARGLT